MRRLTDATIAFCCSYLAAKGYFPSQQGALEWARGANVADVWRFYRGRR